MLVFLATCWSAVTALPRGGMRNALREAGQRRSVGARTKGELYVKQKLDHFDRTNPKTFEQRYFLNDTWFDGSGPVFLCVGGEGPALDASVLVSSVHCNDMVELAPTARALLVALEHRYYGKSMPPRGNESPREYLRFLSTEQALADIAAFHGEVTARYGVPSSTKWVAWGGSYPGLLAGFSRLKLPHLIHAAVSSSAPWKAQVDMRIYNDLVGRALSIESVGGSDACRAAVVDGHAAIKGALDANEGLADLAAAFDLCRPASLADRDVQKSWAGYGVISVNAQENDPLARGPAANVAQICDALLAHDDPVAGLANVSRLQHAGACVQTSSANEIALPALLLDRTDALSWPYQTCTEYGFYQTCELDSDCPFAKGYVLLEDEISMCASLFNISAAEVAINVNFTNLLYGADRPETSRTFFANGNVDPWSGLGVLASPDGNVSEVTLMVDGSSHHFWTHPQDAISQPTVRAAKKAIQDQVLLWLQAD